jgi:hypothetical protein
VQLLPQVHGLVNVIVLAAAEDVVVQQQQVTHVWRSSLKHEVQDLQNQVWMDGWMDGWVVVKGEAW